MTFIKRKILIAEDDLSLRTVLKKLFSKKGFEVSAMGDGELALHKLKEEYHPVAILDIKMPGLTGLEILKRLKDEKISSSIIIMTAQDSMHNTVTAMKEGAYDYIAKPFELDEIEMIVNKAFEAKLLSEEVQQLRQEVGKLKSSEAKIIGSSRAIREIFKTIGRIANNNLPILITGESGTGKELIARAIHQHSLRVTGPFKAVNCAAIPKDLLESELFGYQKGAFTGADSSRPGYFQMAHQGTLFLDEIGDLPPSLQVKLLRILQEKEVTPLGSTDSKAIDVRVLAATNQNLEKMVQEKLFREDLFFRLNVIPIHLPPLRERVEDIPLLCQHFLEKLGKEIGTLPKSLSPQALELLIKYPWPGNIRELENILKRAAILSSHDYLEAQEFAPLLGEKKINFSEEIEATALEALIEKKLITFFTKLSNYDMHNMYDTIIRMAERPLLKLILKKTGYNQIKTAEILGINRNTLRKKIRLLNISLRNRSC